MIDLAADYPTVEWDGRGSLVDFVGSTNLIRRHLTRSQLAATATESLVMFEREMAARAKQKGTTVEKLWQDDQKKNGAKSKEAAFAERAGNLVGVTGRLVAKAKAIGDTSPDLLSEVKAGALSIPQAESLISMEEEDRDAVRQAAEEVGWSQAIKEAKQAREAAEEVTDDHLVKALVQLRKQVTRIEDMHASARLVANQLKHKLQGAEIEDIAERLKHLRLALLTDCK